MDYKAEIDKYFFKKKSEYGQHVRELTDKELARLMPRIVPSNKEQIDFLLKLLAMMGDRKSNEILSEHAEDILVQIVDVYRENKYQKPAPAAKSGYLGGPPVPQKKVKGTAPDYSIAPVLKANGSDPISMVGGSQKSLEIAKFLIQNCGNWFSLEKLRENLNIHQRWYSHLRIVTIQKVEAAGFKFESSRGHGTFVYMAFKKEN